jgi:peptidoglycan/LPS O-acetylase OafA/YrhL
MHRQFPALRGLAIVLVVLNHTIHMGTTYYQDMCLPPLNSWVQFSLDALMRLGIFAVPIFLFLSGCFFAYASGNKDIRSSYKIVWKNLPSVLFPYLVWSIIFYVEVYFLHDQPFTLIGWIKNLIVGYPFNFVPLLLFYYLISPLLIRVGRRLGWMLVVLIGLYQLFLIGITRPGVIGFQLPEWLDVLAPPVLANPLADWAIFFPMGLIYVMTSKTTLPVLQRWKWVFAVGTFVLYVLALLNSLSIISAPLARFIAPVTFMLVTPTINRKAIPWVRQLELAGKYAYGLYLMNLLVLDVTLFVIQQIAPALLNYLVLLLPALFGLTLALPIAIMRAVERFPRPFVYRYIFG